MKLRTFYTIIYLSGLNRINKTKNKHIIIDNASSHRNERINELKKI